jgi:Fic family protein
MQFQPPGTRFVPAEPTAHAPRPAKHGATYAPFVPTSVGTRSFTIGADTSDAAAEATNALSSLDVAGPRLASADALAHAALRWESVASSRIAGVRASHERLGRAAHFAGAGAGDPRANEVLGNLRALEKASEIGAQRPPVTARHIAEIHRTLLRGTEDQDIGGLLRTDRDWVGLDDYNPVGADYVPPPPETLQGLLEDLCVFVERRDLDPTVQAAIAHAQFKNIHPFAAGNGRTARAIIHVVLRRHGEKAALLPPISPVLARRPKAYVGGLGAFSTGNVEVWCQTFAEAVVGAARDAQRLSDSVEALVAGWLERLGNPRSDSAARQIVGQLPGRPVIDAGLAEALTRKSHTAVHNALNQMETVGVLKPLSEKGWGRAWEAREMLDLLGELEQAAGA